MNSTSTSLRGRSAPRSRAGFTLMEIMVALALAAMSSAGIIRGIIVAKGLNQSSEQRVVAFSMAKSQMELFKGRSYAAIMPGPTWEAGLPLTHLGGEAQESISCNRLTNVSFPGGPPRKQIDVWVVWQYRGKTLVERVRGVVYEK